jgi:hypothetical protein
MGQFGKEMMGLLSWMSAYARDVNCVSMPVRMTPSHLIRPKGSRKNVIYAITGWTKGFILHVRIIYV